MLQCFCQGHFEDPLVTETIDVAKESESETLSFTMDFKPKSSGTYAICLDNRSSRFLPKIVQVIVFVVCIVLTIQIHPDICFASLVFIIDIS